MLFKISIFLVSLSCVAAVVVDPYVTKRLEEILDFEDRFLQSDIYDENEFIEAVVYNFLATFQPREILRGNFPKGMSDDRKEALTTLYSLADKFEAASDRTTCKRAIRDLKDIFPSKKGKVGDFIVRLKVKCESGE